MDEEEDDFELVVGGEEGLEPDSISLRKAETLVQEAQSLNWASANENLDLQSLSLCLLATGNHGLEKLGELGLRWSLAIERSREISDPSARRQRLTVMVQRGCPDSHRGQAWKALTGTSVILSDDKQIFRSWKALQADDKRGEARRIRNPPTFSGPHKQDLLPLSDEGLEACNRILAAVGMARPDVVSFCPQLPHLVALLLMYMSEMGACHVVEAIMPQPQDKNLTAGTASALISYQLLPSQHMLQVTLSAFKLKLKQCCPKLVAKMEELQVSAEAIVEPWLTSLFVGHAPLQLSTRAVDVLLCQGLKGLLQICIAIFYYFQEHLVICLSGEGMQQVLARRLSELFQMEDLMQASIDASSRGKVHLSAVDASIASLHLHDHEDGEGNHRDLVYYLPLISPKSEILSEQDIELVWSWLPPRLRVRDGTVIFTSSRDGYSLQQLYLICKKHFEQKKSSSQTGASPGECLLVIRSSGRIIGSFMSDWPRLGSEPNLGTGQSFVFSIRPSERKFSWEPGMPSSFLNCRPDALTIGGSALSIDRYMEKVVSMGSDTFGLEGSLFRDPHCEEPDAWSQTSIGSLELIKIH